MKLYRFAVRAAAGALVALYVTASASAAVLPPSQRVADAKIAEFKNSPQTLLTQNTTAASLTQATKLLVASDASTLSLVISLLTNSSTSPQQVQSLVTGLAQAATLAAAAGDQAFANEIQAAVANTNNPTILAAYQGAVNASLIASTGGAGGGGGGGTGVGGSTGTTGFAFGGSNSGGGGSGFGTGGSSNSGFTTGSASVGGTSSAGGSVSPR
ncbi:MAG: hypothetical protein HZA66_03330 [Rhodopseudomonas palustris]|uniref:Uncharacterized protein n=1 Tax=Rhodopseudomonas palustris TaxID=1076 RepID=A0A933VZH1_RHOPL|nr:hypothetical protein [Rhodopseudomonas palustris]